MYTPSRRLIAATAALGSALFLAGCASDDDPIATPSEPVASASASPSVAPSIDDFCDAKVAIDAAFLAGGPPEDEGATPSPEEVGQGLKAAFGDAYAELKRTAQSDVATEVDAEVSALDAAIDSGDGEFFFKPDFVAADKKIDDFLVDKCDGLHKVSATAAEYEYTGLPSVTPAGLTALTLTNEGEEFHEMILMHIDESLADESLEDIMGMEEEELGDKVMPMGVVLASPGTTATNFFNITSGRYAVLCFISEGSDAEHDFQGDGPPHFTKGMLEPLKVLPGPGEATTAPTSSPSASSSSSSSGSSSTSSDDDEDETSSPEPTSTS